MKHIREDVHIHAPAADVYARIASLATHRYWLAPAFSGVRSSAETLSFELALPLRRERARLTLAEQEPPRLLTLACGDGNAPAAPDAGHVRSLTWALHEESPHEVHVTLEAAYVPAGGAARLLEPLLHAPLRRQAFRDALWRLKLQVECRPEQRGDPPHEGGVA